MIISLTVFYLERSAIHHDTAFPASTLGKGCGYGCGTGSCSASHCYSASPFPNSCPYGVCVSYLCKFYVASLGKSLVSFQDFTIVGDVDGVDVIHEGNEMRITHANIGAFKFSAVSFEHRRAYELLGIFKLGFQHVYCYRFHNFFIILKMKFQYLDTRKRFQSDGVLSGQSFFVKILTDASACIAAHHRF